MKKRLFSIIGPTQLLNVLTLIEAEKEYTVELEDYLLIHDTGVKDLNHYMYKVIQNMAKIHRWKKIIYLNPNSFYGKTRILRELDSTVFDEVYLARNFRHVDECIIELYKKRSKIIIYGDTLGFFDSIADRENISEVRLIIPVIPKSSYNKLKFGKVPIIHINKNYLFDVLKKLKCEFEKVKEIEAINFENIDTLFLTSYYSKVNYCTLEEEIDVYKDAFFRFISNENVMLKAHPRDDMKICEQFKNKLSSISNENEYIYSDFLNAVPMEILLYLFDVKKVVTIRSTAILSAFLINPDIEVCYLDTHFQIEKEGTIQIQQKEFFKYIFENKESIIEGREVIVPVDKEINSSEWYLIELFYSKEEQIKGKIKLVKQLTTSRKIIAYGGGGFLNYLLPYFEEYDVKLDYIVDNSVKEKNTFFYSIPIINKEFLPTIEPKPYILVTSSYEHEIKMDLLRLSFEKYADWIGFFQND